MTAPLSSGLRWPDEIRRGVDYAASLTPVRDGANQATAATLRVLDESQDQVAAPVVSTVAGVCSATILAAVTTAVDPIMGWSLEWTVTLADGSSVVIINPADVVLYVATGTVSWADLLGRKPDLATRLGAADKAPAAILDAWGIVLQKLRTKGKRPCLIVDSFALREAHLLKSLAIVFRGLADGGDGSPEWSFADHFDAAFAAEWESLTFEVADPSTWRRTLDRDSSCGSLWLGSTGTGRYRDYNRLPNL